MKYIKNKKNKKKNKKNYFHKPSFIFDLKKLYKNKKLNTRFIKRRMYRKAIKIYKINDGVRNLLKNKKIYRKFYKYRGSNNRSLLKRNMISKQGKKYRNIG